MASLCAKETQPPPIHRVRSHPLFLFLFLSAKKSVFRMENSVKKSRGLASIVDRKSAKFCTPGCNFIILKNHDGPFLKIRDLKEPFLLGHGGGGRGPGWRPAERGQAIGGLNKTYFWRNFQNFRWGSGGDLESLWLQIGAVWARFGRF